MYSYKMDFHKEWENPCETYAEAETQLRKLYDYLDRPFNGTGNIVEVNDDNEPIGKIIEVELN